MGKYDFSQIFQWEERKQHRQSRYLCSRQKISERAMIIHITCGIIKDSVFKFPIWRVSLTRTLLAKLLGCRGQFASFSTSHRSCDRMLVLDKRYRFLVIVLVHCLVHKTLVLTSDQCKPAFYRKTNISMNLGSCRKDFTLDQPGEVCATQCRDHLDVSTFSPV